MTHPDKSGIIDHMFDAMELREVRSAVCRLASRFDPAVVSGVMPSG